MWKADAPATYTISYNANGGTGAPASQTVAHGQTFTVPSTIPVPDTFGMAFGYWVIWDDQGEILGTAYPGDQITVTCDITLDALWRSPTELDVCSLFGTDAVMEIGETIAYPGEKIFFAFSSSIPSQRVSIPSCN